MIALIAVSILGAVALIRDTILRYQDKDLEHRENIASARLSHYRLLAESKLTMLTEQLATTQKALKRLAEFTAKATKQGDAGKILDPNQGS